MTAILLAIAVLSLAAGFYILLSGRRVPHAEAPADHKMKIRKAADPAPREVSNEPPEGLSAVESIKDDVAVRLNSYRRSRCGSVFKTAAEHSVIYEPAAD